ncbi:MAG: single-stranded-DNA-specific exonuclease RecJ [Gammaproteobacteria bacterium]|nr:single-stranded-DNA-specific exonuclease RecJ [Gammaproteobacteria bacterium]
MQKKIIRRTISESSLAQTDLHPLLQRIYSARGVQTAAELEQSLERLLPWYDLLGILQAVELLTATIAQQKNILIVGDFDADGATGTAVAMRALKSFGVQTVHYLVPNRFSFGYGLTPGLVEMAQSFQPHLIVTVDNGIANHAGVSAAKALGIQVLITDHHLPADTLPSADVIVNPNQPGDIFASKSIAGVGVIFYVMLALRAHLREQKYFSEKKIPEPNLAHLLDLVALGTVADVVPLDHNNRILVHQGLRRIRSGHCIAGIRALLEISQRDIQRIQASDLAFSVAPRLNAAGRLDDMSLGIECLLCDDEIRAREMAEVLSQLNDERRVIEQDMQQQALRAVEKIHLADEKKLPYGLCLFEKDWHQGVIGIVAGRIKDKWHRPVIAFAAEDEKSLKGSARSIPGLHIRDALAEIDAKHPQLIQKFGGHAMAAGLSIARESFKTFAEIFQATIAARLEEKDLQHIILSDGELTPEEHTLSTAELLRAAGPWGQHFPEPIFDGTFDMLEQRIVGSKHLKMTLSQSGQIFSAIAFNVDLNQWPNHRCQQVHIAYRMDVNEYRGKCSMQLIVEHLEVL